MGLEARRGLAVLLVRILHTEVIGRKSCPDTTYALAPHSMRRYSVPTRPVKDRQTMKSSSTNDSVLMRK